MKVTKQFWEEVFVEVWAHVIKKSNMTVKRTK
jgi:hypothetical protein